jgi:hypothetical protein
MLDVYSEYCLLHLAASDNTSNIADVIAKVQYLCDQCPALIHLKDMVGRIALHTLLWSDAKFSFKGLKILCDMDRTIVREKCTPSDITSPHSGQLPLHLLIEHQSPTAEVSDKGDYLRLLLSLYPEAAGIRDDHSMSQYDIAV